ncbi:potassium channel family protein [Salinibacter altiplanensis]|uniref:potassium channel family protein n=1 Tax=Salinibacter altiplanensis TaxID=1803181 RepID=UPI000C9EF586|nr:potassium channel protein [Salinibacter altiplanensis]
MTFLTRRTVYYLLVLVAATLGLTAAYSLGMSLWEGRPRPWYQALEVVVQTFTTTGYGEDAPWSSPQMNVLVIVIQLAGIGFILSAVDVFVVPWLREALRPTAPTTLSSRSGHVIVCGYTPRVEVFIGEMSARGQDYVLIEPDADRAASLYEQEYEVMEGDPTSTAVLERASVGAAKALVADVADDENASIVLAAREASPERRIITLAEDASATRYHRAAGADVALSPRQLLGRSLAAKVPVAAAANVEEQATIGAEIDFAELIVTRHGPSHDHSLHDLRLTERFGVRVVGAWFEGTFETSVDADTPLEAGTRLFLAGTPDQLDALRDEMAPYVRAFTPQSIILAGHGDSGEAARESLRAAHAEVTVLDLKDGKEVDVAGDVRDPDALRTCGIEDASALIIAVDDDSVATFATLIARDLNPEVQILVRTHDEMAVQNLYRAGADFVQALPTVCGRMLAATIFEDEGYRSRDRHINVVRLPASPWAGKTLGEVDPDAQTNYTVLAVYREGDFLTDPDDALFAFEADDEVLVAGTEDGIQQFRARFEPEKSSQ